MSKAHSEALRRHWRDPAYRAKQAASRTGASDALTAEIVRLRDDEHMLLKDIGARLHMSGPAARARYERATTRARIAEMERGHAELAQALAVAEEQNKTYQTALDAIDRHIIGVCGDPDHYPEPCEECGEMREIASQALREGKNHGR